MMILIVPVVTWLSGTWMLNLVYATMGNKVAITSVFANEGFSLEDGPLVVVEENGMAGVLTRYSRLCCCS